MTERETIDAIEANCLLGWKSKSLLARTKFNGEINK